MFSRRRFLQLSGLSSLGLVFQNTRASVYGHQPLVMATWAPNVKANAVAWDVISAGGTALDAVEAGVQVPEADPADSSVGYGGLPDRDGHVTLDACIMDHRLNCGSVMFVEGIKHPIRLARMVMEKTPHVQLVGAGALQFALEQGFVTEDLLTESSEKAWKNWLKNSHYDPMTIPRLLEQRSKPGQQDNHDTIGMLAMDAAGRPAGACTTSGMAFKMRGRVGDSPIIGAGLYVDGDVGAATATGVGEEVVRICGAHTVVELMRQGFTPAQACRRALDRLIKVRGKKAGEVQVGFIAIDKKGNFGGYAIQPGFSYAVHTAAGAKVYQAQSVFAK